MPMCWASSPMERPSSPRVVASSAAASKIVRRLSTPSARGFRPTSFTPSNGRDPESWLPMLDIPEPFPRPMDPVSKSWSVLLDIIARPYVLSRERSVVLLIGSSPETLRTKPMRPAVDAAPSLAHDFAAVKGRQQKTWASGDFSVVASRIVFQAEHLCETADIQAGWRVLDVATGSGNAAIAAARRGCEAVGVDYVPALLERGRIRAAAEHLDVQFVEGDAEDLRFPDASFDPGLSINGVMFPPDHRRAAAELARVCRLGRRGALASWTPDGFI